MDTNELIQHWNYFCYLAEKLDETRNYVYHGITEKQDGTYQLVHANVFSDAFKQMIILAASEFEIIGKTICVELGDTADNIIGISKTILEHFPNIIKTEISSMFWVDTPLGQWTVSENGKCEGLDWWRAYNALKHDEHDSYKQASLRNAVNSVGALFVVDLYLMYLITGSLSMALELPPKYFRSKYTANYFNTGEGLLPDFGDKSAVERLDELLV